MAAPALDFAPTLSFERTPGALTIDLPKLLVTRALIQGDSGSGKSWLARWLLEQTHGTLPHLVFDPEGEFYTLRERFDYLLVGKGGDLPAVPAHAATLCRHIAELRASVIFDLSELSIDAQRSYCANYFTALVELPATLRAHQLLFLDEAQVIAPEDGKSEATGPTADVVFRGRKRGICLPPGELVITMDGPRPIEAVRVGDLVLTHRGRFRPVVNVSSRFVGGEIVAVRSANCLFPTRTTPDHEYHVHQVHNSKHGSRVVNSRTWMPARNLVVGEAKETTRTFAPTILEEVPLDRLEAEYDPRVRQPRTERGRRRRVRRRVSVPVTSALMRVVGWYLAEGGIMWRQHQRGRYPSKVIFHLGRHEAEPASAIQADLAELGFRSHRVYGETAIRVQVASRPLAELMRATFGDGAGAKVIPMRILLLPRVLLSDLLCAYLAGDGWHQRAGKRSPGRTERWTSATVSRDLAVALRLLGDKLGLFSGIQLMNREGNDVIQGRTVRCRTTYTNTFSRGGGTAKRLEDGTACFTVRSRQSEAYEGLVYDLQVGEDHSFCTVGHVVHNCLVAATPRISSISKDVAALLGNVFVGYTGLDIDIDRAAKRLGFRTREQRGTLPTLEPGEFYVHGPALAKVVERVRVPTDLKTTHPKVGELRPTAPPPPDAVRKLIAELQNVAGEAEEEARTVEALEEKMAELARRLRERERGAPAAERVVERTVVDHAAVARAVAAERAGFQRFGKSVMDSIADRFRELLGGPEFPALPDDDDSDSAQRVGAEVEADAPIADDDDGDGEEEQDETAAPNENSTAPTGITVPQRRILDGLALLEALGARQPSRLVLAMAIGKKAGARRYRDDLGALRVREYIHYPVDGCVALLAAGRSVATWAGLPKSRAERRAAWRAMVTAPQRAIVDACESRGPLTRGELAAALGKPAGARRLRDDLAWLRLRGLVCFPDDGTVDATARARGDKA